MHGVFIEEGFVACGGVVYEAVEQHGRAGGPLRAQRADGGGRENTCYPQLLQGRDIRPIVDAVRRHHASTSIRRGVTVQKNDFTLATLVAAPRTRDARAAPA